MDACGRGGGVVIEAAAGWCVSGTQREKAGSDERPNTKVGAVLEPSSVPLELLLSVVAGAATSACGPV